MSARQGGKAQPLTAAERAELGQLREKARNEALCMGSKLAQDDVLLAEWRLADGLPHGIQYRLWLLEMGVYGATGVAKLLAADIANQQDLTDADPGTATYAPLPAQVRWELERAQEFMLHEVAVGFEALRMARKPAGGAA